MHHGVPMHDGLGAGCGMFVNKKHYHKGDTYWVTVRGYDMQVGFCTTRYNPLRDNDTFEHTAGLDIKDGSTFMHRGAADDGEQHAQRRFLLQYVPKKLPFEIALRTDHDNVPQVQFGGANAVWHDLCSDRSALKPGVWHPCIHIHPESSIDFRDQPNNLLMKEKTKGGSVNGGAQAKLEAQRKANATKRILKNQTTWTPPPVWKPMGN